MKKWSGSWKGSKKRRKQIKYVKNAPLHIKIKFMTAPLSKELRKKYNRRNIGVIEGDKVKIIRGQFKKTSGKVAKVNTKRQRIYIEGAELVKKDGSKTQYPIHPSNVMITEMKIEDKKRKKILDRKAKGAK
ncbi:MAG: 50S ribosomal protein L24 [archaeon]